MLISSTQLKSRRQELKSKRRLKTLLVALRTLLITSLAGGTFWLVTLPDWVIRNSDEIEIEGNQFLSVEEIRSLIPLSYPQPLLQLSIEELTEKLKAKAPFEDISISRTIIPPSITIKIEERQPVAMAFAPVSSSPNHKAQVVKVGYLDAKGILVPKEFYQDASARGLKIPIFKVIGFPEQYLPYWEQLYGLINQFELKITEIDWQDPNNLILKTELGKVYLGAYTSKLPQQLTVLAKMKQLPEKVHPSQIIYIDLSDPQWPSIKQKTPPHSEKET